MSPPTASADSLLRLVDKKATEEVFLIGIRANKSSNNVNLPLLPCYP